MTLLEKPKPTLAVAVLALTRPDVLLRKRGEEHQHQWVQLTRPLTTEERAARKKAKKPFTILDEDDTGRMVRKPVTISLPEHVCKWCDATTLAPDTPDPIETVDRHDDEPLLDQLEAAVRPFLGDGGAGSKGGMSVLVNVEAFNRYDEIDGRIRAWLMTLGGTPGKGLSLAQLLTSWHTLYISGVQPVGEEDRYRDVVVRWQTEIRDILDPPTQIPYRGQPCPVCGETRAVVPGDLGPEETVALWAFLRPKYRDEGSYGLCKACKTVLAREDDPLDLRARMNGAVAPATRLTQTIAEATDIAVG